MPTPEPIWAGAGGSSSGPAGRAAAPAVWLTLLVTMLGYGGAFTRYVHHRSAADGRGRLRRRLADAVAPAFGAGFFVGNYACGRLADRWPNGSAMATSACWPSRCSP